jgi:hypothetical protein
VPRKYSDEELHRRALALYEGKPLRASSAPGPVPAETTPPAAPPAAGATSPVGTGTRLLVVSALGAAAVAAIYAWSRHSERRRLAAKARVRAGGPARDRDTARRVG